MTAGGAPAPDSLPTVHVGGGAEQALARGALATLDGEPLARFLAPRRWFGGKGSAVGRARVADVVALGLAPPAAVALIEVAPAGASAGASAAGPPALYQLPLVVRQVGRENGRGGPGAVLARVECAGGHALLFDATEDPDFRRALGGAFSGGAVFAAADGARWEVRPGGGIDPSAAADSRLLAAEQSNTSVVYGDQAILKLFRRLEAGEHPDVEIARFLGERTGFRNTPALLGVLEFVTSRGARGVAGMLQRFVPGSQDAWSYALRRVTQWLAAGEGAGAAAAGGFSGGFAGDFTDDAAELGRITRALHEALASAPGDPAFGPQPAGPADVARWVDGAVRSVESGLALLAAQCNAGALDAVAAENARLVLAHRPELVAVVRGAGHALAGHAGALIRHHGDFHLGQVLRAADGTFYLIDFEGEPARPLAERRERHGALRDVAGMLRSFAYAAAVGATEARAAATEVRADASRGAAAGGGPTSVEHRVAERAGRWEAAVRGAFLAAYLAPSGGPANFLPDSPEGVDRLLTLFELEKVFYELAYELNNRPSWVWIPLAGIARVLQQTPGPAAGARAGRNPDRQDDH